MSFSSSSSSRSSSSSEAAATVTQKVQEARRRRRRPTRGTNAKDDKERGIKTASRSSGSGLNKNNKVNDGSGSGAGGGGGRLSAAGSADAEGDVVSVGGSADDVKLSVEEGDMEEEDDDTDLFSLERSSGALDQLFAVVQSDLFRWSLWSYGFHRAKWRYLHRAWTVIVLLSWSGFMLVQDLRNNLGTIALAEFSSAIPFLFCYLTSQYYFHSDHLAKMVKNTCEVIDDGGRRVARAVKWRFYASLVIYVLVVVSWQGISNWLISAQFKKDLDGELLASRIIISVGFVLYTPVLLFLFLCWSIVAFLHIAQAKALAKKVKAQVYDVDDLRFQLKRLDKSVRLTTAKMGWILGAVLIFCVITFSLFLLIALAELKSLIWLYFSAVPLVLALFILLEGARVALAMQELREAVVKLASNSKFENLTYNRSSIDSLVIYSSNSAHVIEIFYVPLVPSIFAAVFTIAFTITIIGLRLYVSDQGLAEAVAE